jgi:sodium transport system permease protein
VSAALYALMGPAVILLVSLSGAAQKGGPSLLLAMMSVFALVAVFTGGMHIALDSTAGERERGSLVPLLLNPVSRLHLVVGKWLGVLTVTLIGLGFTLAGFSIVFEWGGVIPPAERLGVVQLWVLCGLIPLALLGAALNVLAATTCKTLKEAQARLSMVMFVPMIVGMFLVFFPDRLGQWWFVLPVVGQQAFIGIGLRGGAVSFWQVGLLALITTAVTAAMLVAAAWAMKRDDIVAG